MPKLIIASLILFSSLNALAQDASGMLGASDNYVGSVAQGAFDNRNSANQLYQQSGRHEREARHHRSASGAPDAALLAKAFAEGQQAFTADNQAQEMAKAALTGVQSASQQENQSSSSAISQVNVAALQSIADEQSPYAQQVEATFAGYGLSLGTDQSTLATPALVTYSGSSGTTRTPASLTSGVVAAQSSPAGVLAAVNGTSATASGIEAQNAAANKNTSLAALNKNTVATSGGPEPAIATAGTSDALDAKQLLARNRNLILKQMGRAVAGDEDVPESPIRPKTEDIFQVVHMHYKFLLDGGSFYESHLPAMAEPSTLPPFSSGL